MLCEKWKKRHQDAHEVSDLDRESSAQHHHLFHKQSKQKAIIYKSLPSIHRSEGPVIITSTSIEIAQSVLP